MSNAPPPWQSDGVSYGPPPGADPSGQPHPPGLPGPSANASNGLAIAALVVGILALLGTITLIGGVLLGLVAIVLGVLGLSKARELGSGRAQAIAGIVLGAISVLLVVVIVSAGLLVSRQIIEGGSVEGFDVPVEELELPGEDGATTGG